MIVQFVILMLFLTNLLLYNFRIVYNMFLSKVVFIFLFFDISKTVTKLLQSEENRSFEIEEERETIWIDYLTKVMKRLKGFDMVFHCIESNLTEINIVIDKLNFKENNSTYFAVSVQTYNVSEKNLTCFFNWKGERKGVTNFK